MVTQTYKLSFEASILSYTGTKAKQNITYKEQRLTDQLVDHVIRGLLKDALGNPVERLRLQAVKKLGQWGNQVLELQILTRLYTTDPNLEMKKALSQAITKIRSRILQH